MVLKNPLRFGVAALIAIALSTSHSWAARSSGARLTIAENKVSIAGRAVTSGTTIAPGDTITTGPRSHAELTLPDGTVVRIGQGSSFTYTGSKLVLNQGTALIHVTHKNTTVVSGSRTYTGGPAVVSAEVSKKTDGLYILQGGGKVNGVTLIPGQSSLLDHGKERTITFDLQKMESSSALVTKFPQTPWIVQTEALGAVQHQLLTAKVAPAGKPRARSGVQGDVSGSLASVIGTGGTVALGSGRSGIPSSPGGGALQLLGGPLSLGADKVAVIKSAAISSSVSGGTLQVSGAITIAGASASTIALSRASGITVATIAPSSGTLTLTGGAAVINGAGASTLMPGNNLANFNLNSAVSFAGGTSILAGNNILTKATTLNTGTLILSNPSSLGPGTLNVGAPGVVFLTNPNLTIANIGTISPGATINYPTGGTIVFGGVTLPQQAGQTVTINGVNYITTQSAGAAGLLSLQRTAH